MRQFIAFIKKEFYHIFRDKRTMLFLLGMPVVQIILFGFAITTEVSNSKIAIYDASKDPETEQIIEKFKASKYFTVTQILSAGNQINDVFKDGEIDLVLVFPGQFATDLIHTSGTSLQLIADGTDPNRASTLVGYASNIIQAYQQEMMSQHQIPCQIIPEIKMLYNPQMKGAYNFVPGVMAMIMMLICAMMTSIAIVKEKETGTMEVLLASPIKPIFIILAKAIPYFALSVFNLITILLLSVFVLHVPIAGSLFWLFLTSLIYISLALALGLLISTLVKTQVAAMLASGMVLMLPIILLSGMMFPIESMPRILQWVSAIIPARWYIEAVKKIMIQGVEIRFAIQEITILCGMSMALILISLKKFKTRLN